MTIYKIYNGYGLIVVDHEVDKIIFEYDFMLGEYNYNSTLFISNGFFYTGMGSLYT